MKKLIEWLGMSNRWKHLVRRTDYRHFCIWLVYRNVCRSFDSRCLEYKDKVYGGRWDWIDFGLTVAGAMIGQLIGGTLIWNN